MNNACYPIEISFVIFIAGMLAALIPLVMMNYLTRVFDSELLVVRYWNFEAEKRIGFFKYRRAMVYLASLGAKWLGERKFPGSGMRALAARGLVVFSRFYMALFSVALFGGVLGVVLALRCGS